MLIHSLACLGIWIAAEQAPQPPPTAQPSTDPASRPTEPLSGPKAREAGDGKPTLVHRDLEGQVRRTERTPEEEAVDLLTVDAETRKSLDRIIAQRAAMLDQFVVENVDLLTKFGQAAATNNKVDQFALLMQASGKLTPLFSKGTLAVQFRQVLPEESRGAFDHLLGAYWDAVVAEQQAAAAPKDQSDGWPMAPTAGAAHRSAPAKSRMSILGEERLKSLGKEIELAFQRQLYSGDFLYSYVTRGIELTDEQSATIRGLCREFAEKTKGNPTEAQNKQLFLSIASVLTVAQQTQAIRNVKGLGTKGH